MRYWKLDIKERGGEIEMQLLFCCLRADQTGDSWREKQIWGCLWKGSEPALCLLAGIVFPCYFLSVVLAVYVNQCWWPVEDVVKMADPSRDGLISARMLFSTVSFTLEVPSQNNPMELPLVSCSSCFITCGIWAMWLTKYFTCLLLHSDMHINPLKTIFCMQFMIHLWDLLSVCFYFTLTAKE